MTTCAWALVLAVEKVLEPVAPAATGERIVTASNSANEPATAGQPEMNRSADSGAAEPGVRELTEFHHEELSVDLRVLCVSALNLERVPLAHRRAVLDRAFLDTSGRGCYHDCRC